MRLPRDVSGEELARLLEGSGYRVTRQTGIHLRLTRRGNGEHHITIPRHGSLKVGTLSAILKDIAQHLDVSKTDLIRSLWG